MILAVSPAKIDRYIFRISIASFLKAITESSNTFSGFIL